MVGRQARSSNGREASAKVPQAPPEPIPTKALLAAAAELSRKIQWAIGTSWYSATGARAPKAQVDYLASRMAADAVEELNGTHMQGHHPAPPDQPAG